MAHRLMAESDVVSLFPTLVWRFELNPSAREDLNTRVLTALAQLRPEEKHLDSSRAWQSRHNPHQLPAFDGLIRYVQDSAVKVLEFMRVGHEGITVTGCWANINPPGVAHRIHSHPNNFLSGVYYVRCQTGADTINFHDP